MSNFCRALRVFHLKTLGFHSEAFVEVRVENFNPLLFEPADHRITLLSLVVFLDIARPAASSNEKNIRFMRPACVDQPILQPMSGSKCILGDGREHSWNLGSRKPCQCAVHEFSAIHHRVILPNWSVKESSSFVAFVQLF